ncbi:glycoside hydrolase superfamily [Desarmillaria tabescens]|uniref:Glycoside hydrolase superfamily n=1 Tax=Armillaria tabescens TaxID=1929756 RepID=A0AA39J647_ARMTA|nr:glycoside hydrolase superfamily [Desarmillaria tabescens]KAK0436821.1 glycoside hydrolase superfamily [Desarmillaria tabescens]
MLIEVLLLLFAYSSRWGGISVVLAQSGSTGTSSSVVSTTTGIPSSTSVSTATVTFLPIGSIPRDYTPEGLEQLWDIVGPVEPPPFTTTRVPTAAVTLPPSPPPLYPSFYAQAPKDVLPDLKFPKGFKFGVATAAYQVEGAAKDEGKGPTMWDWATRQPNATYDNTTGDIVDLQYFLYKEDVQRIAALGVTAHSFSISWARIYPFGAANSPINTAGIDHYSDVIDYHLDHGVEPVVTLFHWDTPLALQAYYGAFTSPQIVDDFVNYAKTVFQAYNGRVKTWYTFNEPGAYCNKITAYPFNVTLAPSVNSSTAFYQCAYNLLRAHAGAVKAFREMRISGEISFKNSGDIGTPWRSNSTEDALAVERKAAFDIGLFANPVYTTGDWPDIVKDTLPADYLPRFTDEEKTDLLGSADFFAIDPYHSTWIKAPDEGIDACITNTSNPLWPGCNEPVYFDSGYGWSAGPASGQQAYSVQATPVAIRTLFKGIHSRWPSNKMYVSEFGAVEPLSFPGTDISIIKDDVLRTNYYLTYLGEMLLSIHEDGVPIDGAFAWAMIDNAEWSFGTIVRFGIQYVDYTTLERTYKRSALSLCELLDAFQCSQDLQSRIAEFFGSHLQN